MPKHRVPLVIPERTQACRGYAVFPSRGWRASCTPRYASRIRTAAALPRVDIIGWLMYRTSGGLIAGSLFILPGILAIMALSMIYAAVGQGGAMAALFFRLKAAVLAIVLHAVAAGVGRRALANSFMITLASVAFVAIFSQSAAATGALRLETKIPLGAITGRIDHLAIDVARRRLYVAELGDNSLGIVDLEAGTVRTSRRPE